MTSNWILPSNQKRYDSIQAFKQLGTITWNLNYRTSVAVGDTVYLYISKPTQEIQIRAIVSAVPGTDIEDADHWQEGADDKSDKPTLCSFDLELEAIFPNEVGVKLHLNELTRHGMNSHPQSFHSLTQETVDYIREVTESEDWVSDSAAESLETSDDLVAEFKAQIQDGNYSVQDKRRWAKYRGSAQQAFAGAVKKNYDFKCALTGISTPEFLVASHIVRWADDESIRLDPSNGICLSVFVDKAFEHGYLRINDQLIVEVSADTLSNDPELTRALSVFRGMALHSPENGAPNPEYLRRRMEK